MLYISMSDVGCVFVVLLIIFFLDILVQVYFSGDSKLMVDIVRIMEKEWEVMEFIKVEEIVFEFYKVEVFVNLLLILEKYLRFFMGEGMIDYIQIVMGNDNVLVEKDLGFGWWWLMKDLVVEMKGLLWVDYDQFLGQVLLYVQVVLMSNMMIYCSESNISDCMFV